MKHWLGLILVPLAVAAQGRTPELEFVSSKLIAHSNDRLTNLSLAQPSGPAWSKLYVYDAVPRLQTLTSPAGTFTYAYRHDPSSPRPDPLIRQLTLPNGSAITNAFDGLAQILETTLRSAAGNLSNIRAYKYDAEGRRTNTFFGGQRHFLYDDENQLISVTASNAWRSEFAYDALRRRNVRREFTWSTGSGTFQLVDEVRYVYDGSLVIQERDGSNTPLVSYTRGLDLSGTMQGAGGIGGLLAFTQHGSPSTHAYYHSDAQGNVTVLVRNA